MSFIFGEKSEIKLLQATMNLQHIFRMSLALGLIDFSIIESYREKKLQDKYYRLGKSRVQWPNSKHNRRPSSAVDVAPFINGKSSYKWEYCVFLAGIVLAVAKKHSLCEIRWGGNWDMDGEPITDQSLQDLVHYEEI